MIVSKMISYFNGGSTDSIPDAIQPKADSTKANCAPSSARSSPQSASPTCESPRASLGATSPLSPGALSPCATSPYLSSPCATPSAPSPTLSASPISPRSKSTIGIIKEPIAAIEDEWTKLRNCKTPTARAEIPTVAYYYTKETEVAASKVMRRQGPPICGASILKNGGTNKGQAFTIKERQTLGIHGLLPPAVRTQDEQMEIVMQNFKRYSDDLNRYIYIMSLGDRNEKLFYHVIMNHIELMMPVIYTPTVGLACQKYGLIFRKPRGLFITINDKGHIYDMLCNWPEQDVKAIVVTDGERILGLGDLGAYGMGIPVGKLALYTACAMVKPHQCLPITLDVGTNNKSLLEDPCYIGLRQSRVTGQAYDDFIDEFMQAVVRRYGQNTLIQFEDFGNHNAFRFLSKYKPTYCTFNDDIQGTAAVSLAGLIASTRMTGKKLSENKYLFQGAGEAAIGIAKLLVMAMQEEGVSAEKALERIWMVDSKGLIVKDRPKGGLNEEKMRFAKEHPPVDSLTEVVKTIKPTAIIGVAAIGGAFTEEIIKDMASFNERPIIFALSNPTSKAECTAEQAYTLTEGRCIFASGSPFQPVTLNGKTYYPGQGNNAYIFPGVALAVVACSVKHIPESVFLKSAQRLAELVTDAHIAEGRVYPTLSEIQEVSVQIAIALAEHVYKEKLASFYPEPADKEAFIRGQLYSTKYDSFLPDTYDWPTSKF